MDAQLKRGMLEACVLSVLARGDSYGYQLVKDISGCVEVSESTLYPILRRLEARVQPRAQRAAAQVLRHHRCGARTSERIARGMEAGASGLYLYYGRNGR